MSIVLTLAVSWLAAMAHVCRLHGTARYTGLQRCMRKSWPVVALPNVLLYLFTLRRAGGAFVPLDHYPSLAGLGGQVPLLGVVFGTSAARPQLVFWPLPDALL